MIPSSDDIGVTTEAYAAYINAPRNFLDSEEQRLMDEDIEKARTVMELVWLKAKPTRTQS